MLRAVDVTKGRNIIKFSFMIAKGTILKFLIGHKVYQTTNNESL